MRHFTPGSLLYALACLIVPIAWGLVVVWASNHIEHIWRTRNGNGEDIPPIEYHI